MAERHHPAPVESTTADRTSALVAGGLALMAVLGVVTVFSDAIAAAWSPSSPAAADQAATAPAGHPTAPSATAGGDGGPPQP